MSFSSLLEEKAASALRPPPLTPDQAAFVRQLSEQAAVLEQSWTQLDEARAAFESEKAAWAAQVTPLVALSHCLV